MTVRGTIANSDANEAAANETTRGAATIKNESDVCNEWHGRYSSVLRRSYISLQNERATAIGAYEVYASPFNSKDVSRIYLNLVLFLK